MEVPFHLRVVLTISARGKEHNVTNTLALSLSLSADSPHLHLSTAHAFESSLSSLESRELWLVRSEL